MHLPTRVQEFRTAYGSAARQPHQPGRAPARMLSTHAVPSNTSTHCNATSPPGPPSYRHIAAPLQLCAQHSRMYHCRNSDCPVLPWADTLDCAFTTPLSCSGDQAREAAGDLWPPRDGETAASAAAGRSPPSATVSYQKQQGPTATAAAVPGPEPAAHVPGQRRILGFLAGGSWSQKEEYSVLGQQGTSGRMLLQQQQPEPLSSPAAPGLPPLTDAGQYYVQDMQGMPYTLAIAGLTLAAVAVLRLIASVLYVKLISKDPNPHLAFPRAETMYGTLVLVALTFYACMALGGPEEQWRNSRLAAALVLLLLVVPFGMFLWWLALARAWMVAQYKLVVSCLEVGDWGCFKLCVNTCALLCRKNKYGTHSPHSGEGCTCVSCLVLADSVVGPRRHVSAGARDANCSHRRGSRVQCIGTPLDGC